MRDLGQGKEFVDDEGLQLCAVCYGNMHEVVLAATDVVQGEGLGQGEGFLDEVGGRVACVWTDLNAKEGLLAPPEEAREHVRTSSDDRAISTHPPDPLQTSTRSHTHLGGNVLVRCRRINLQ